MDRRSKVVYLKIPRSLECVVEGWQLSSGAAAALESDITFKGTRCVWAIRGDTSVGIAIYGRTILDRSFFKIVWRLWTFHVWSRRRELQYLYSIECGIGILSFILIWYFNLILMEIISALKFHSLDGFYQELHWSLQKPHKHYLSTTLFYLWSYCGSARNSTTTIQTHSSCHHERRDAVGIFICNCRCMPHYNYCDPKYANVDSISVIFADAFDLLFWMDHTTRETKTLLLQSRVFLGIANQSSRRHPLFYMSLQRW